MTHTTHRHRIAVIAALFIAGTAPFALVACAAGLDASTAKEIAAAAGTMWSARIGDTGFTVQYPMGAPVDPG